MAWWPVEQIETQMGETFAVRVLDALDSHEPSVRLHDGVRLIGEEPQAQPA